MENYNKRLTFMSLKSRKRGESRLKKYSKKSWLNSSHIWQDVHVQIQEAERNLNSINPKRSTSRYIWVKLKTKDKEKKKTLKVAWEKRCVPVGKKQFDRVRLLLRIQEGQKSASHCSDAEWQASIQNFIISKNILHAWRRNEDSFRWRVTRICCQRSNDVRTTDGSSLTRRKMAREGVFGSQDGGKNTGRRKEHRK